MKLKKLLHALGLAFPKKSAELWDHISYQCGNKDLDKDVKKVFVCLDFSEGCFNKAKEFNPDLIITHHPFFFGDKKEIRLSDPLKAKLEKRIYEELHCPIYSYHTNFDVAKGGMNDQMLLFLGVTGQEVKTNPMMRKIVLDKGVTTSEYASYLAKKFNFSHLSYIDNGKINKTIIFLCGGAGNEFMDAINEGCDLYISGDASHHARLDMKRYNLNYIELYHECEETLFLKGMGEFLLKKDSSLDVFCYAYEEIMEGINLER